MVYFQNKRGRKSVGRKKEHSVGECNQGRTPSQIAKKNLTARRPGDIQCLAEAKGNTAAGSRPRGERKQRGGRPKDTNEEFIDSHIWENFDRKKVTRKKRHVASPDGRIKRETQISEERDISKQGFTGG